MDQWKQIKKICKRLRKRYPRQMMFAVSCFALLLLFLGGAAVKHSGEQQDVYAAAEQMTGSGTAAESLPLGISGALTGVMETRIPYEEVERIGTSCEEVLVGQRRRKIEAVSSMNAAVTVENAVDTISKNIQEKSANAKMMSDVDYATLLSIVEAESGGEDLKGRILVANVIMNRVENELFPDNVYDVVYEVSGGAAQFSPTEDGRISTVTVSDTTVEAVKAALEGTDYSEGALFFVAKDQANQDNVKWFEADLEPLFEHGVHSFYTYPDLV